MKAVRDVWRMLEQRQSRVRRCDGGDQAVDADELGISCERVVIVF